MRQPAVIQTGGSPISSPRRYGVQAATVKNHRDPGCTPNLSIDPQAVADAGLWRDARALILQNEVPEAVNVSAARAAKATGAIVCLNAAPVRTLPSELASLVDVLVVNAVEAEDMGGIAVDDLPSALAAAGRLSSGFGTVVVTAGGAGVAGLERGAEASALPA